MFIDMRVFVFPLKKKGMTVDVFVEKLGLTDVGEVLGTWAAAVVAASAVYPVTISMTAVVAPALARARARLTRN